MWRYPAPERRGPPFVGTYQGETEETDHLLRVAVVRHLHRKKNGPPFWQGEKWKSGGEAPTPKKERAPPFGKGRDGERQAETAEKKAAGEQRAGERQAETAEKNAAGEQRAGERQDEQPIPRSAWGAGPVGEHQACPIVSGALVGAYTSGAESTGDWPGHHTSVGTKGLVSPARGRGGLDGGRSTEEAGECQAGTAKKRKDSSDEMTESSCVTARC